jgi:hypothetical protein
MQDDRAHIVYCDDRMLLDKGPYGDWRAVQESYADYKASLGPYSEEDIVHFLRDDWGRDEAQWPFSRDSIAAFFRSEQRLLRAREPLDYQPFKATRRTLPWWAILLIMVAGAGVGVVVFAIVSAYRAMSSIGPL